MLATSRKTLKIEAEKKTHVERSKDPKAPVFPAIVQATAQKLREIIDVGNEQSPLAYAALSRLSVLWTPDIVLVDKTKMLNELVRLLTAIFPKE